MATNSRSEQRYSSEPRPSSPVSAATQPRAELRSSWLRMRFAMSLAVPGESGGSLSCGATETARRATAASVSAIRMEAWRHTNASSANGRPACGRSIVSSESKRAPSSAPSYVPPGPPPPPPASRLASPGNRRNTAGAVPQPPSPPLQPLPAPPLPPPPPACALWSQRWWSPPLLGSLHKLPSARGRGGE
eukprot:scaffold8942_cov99-Isochrysis_galbana.AAC.5